MKLPNIIALGGGVSAFTIKTDFNIDGTGQSRLVKDSNCFYTPDQADCTEGFCFGGTLSNFAGSDIGNLLPNNAKPTEFCDNFYADWYGPLTELHFYCQYDPNDATSGAVRAIKGKYGPKAGHPPQWGPTHGNDDGGYDVSLEALNLVDANGRSVVFSIEIDYTPHEVLHYLAIGTTDGPTSHCGRTPVNKAKMKSLVIPIQTGCSIQHVSGTYVETEMGEFKPGLYGLSFIITC